MVVVVVVVVSVEALMRVSVPVHWPSPNSFHAILKQRPSECQMQGAREHDVQIPSIQRSIDCAHFSMLQDAKIPRRAGREWTAGSELNFTEKIPEIRPEATER